MNKSLFFLVFLAISMASLSSCKNESSSMFGNNNILIELDSEYKANPTPATANALLREVLQMINSDQLNEEKKDQYLNYGYDIAKKENMKSRQAAFLFPLIKKNTGSEDVDDKLYELAELMKSLHKPSAANTLYRGILDNHPDFEKAGELERSMTVKVDSINNYIAHLGKQIFEDADNSGINRKASLAFVDACEAYALAYPNSKNAPENLFKAAEVAKSIRTFPKSLSIYDWILEKYPNYEKASTSLFLKGFIIENSLGDDEKAKVVYLEFLQKYPKHDLADDVEFLIENLGKTDEEILDMIESKRKENASK